MLSASGMVSNVPDRVELQIKINSVIPGISGQVSNAL